ncbi:MAG: hypothetical protein RMM98_14595 [Acidobacteriota bacterium]|nr:hypothetical protein [Blastocatellia bacterium]MDW8240835.1 hypothetical protein [Acidobacteriota bacterium]
MQRSGLRAQQPEGGRIVSLLVPARRLKPGQYELTLRGVKPDGELEDVGFYYLDVTGK